MTSLHDSVLLYNRSIELSVGGQREAALVAINQAIANAPLHGFFYSHRALLHEEGGQLAEAVADYTRAIELLPDSIWPKVQSAEALERDERLRAYWRRGFVRSELGDDAGAMQDWVSAADRGYPEAVAYITKHHAKEAAVSRLADLECERDGCRVYASPAEALVLLNELARSPSEGVTARLDILLYTVLIDLAAHRALLAKLRTLLDAYIHSIGDRSAHDTLHLLIYNCAALEAVLGDRKRALALLAEAKQLGMDLRRAPNDSEFASLYHDPEFTTLTAS
ncbi:MAG: Tetratricopeptide 1 repeat-containing protein [Myxococcales bacterium]|nr:Tetratricopeptide 1 repeat-containing protein [Myxococcales bacterium]